MSIHIFHNPTTNSIIRLSICFILLVAIGQYLVNPPPHLASPEITFNLPLQVSTAGLTASDWQSILHVLQDSNASLPSYPDQGNGHLSSGLVKNQLQFTQHPLSIEQWLQRARVNPSDAAPSQAFGYSLAIDGNTLVVGAYWTHSSGVYGTGAAYVFVKPAAGWSAVSQVAKLTASDFAYDDKLGWSVAISGNTIVAGAIGDDSPGFPNHGSAYVFVKPGGGWEDMTETAKLTASDKASSDEFGRSVAISGDTIAVGVPYEGGLVNREPGIVYVFTKPVSGWVTSTETAQLTASDRVAADGFGYSVAISDNTIVAGAYTHDNGHGLGSGQAYVFAQSGAWTSSTENARLTASDSGIREYFGFSAAIDGDLIVLGAPGEDTSDASGEDSAYVFIKPVGGWSGNRTETAILTASDGEISDDFGHSVAVSGDLIVVGAPKDDIDDEPNQGSAYVFSKPTSGWVNMTETDKLLASDGTDSDTFGNVVGVFGTTIAIGAPKHDANLLTDSGSSYLFEPQPVFTESIYLPFVTH